MPLTTGQVLENRYRIDALLGRGGMGAVYRALHLSLDTSVVVKENPIGSDEAQRQFSREAGLLAKLRHPHFRESSTILRFPGRGSI
jgi:serine/threonine protein kinase